MVIFRTEPANTFLNFCSDMLYAATLFALEIFEFPMGGVNLMRCERMVDEQVKTLKERLVIEPNDGIALYQLGRLCARGGGAEQAIEYLSQAVSAKPDNGKAYVALGDALLSKERLLEAICAYRQAISIDSSLSEGFHGLGRGLLLKGEIELGLGALRAAVRLAPQCEEYLTSLAFSLCAAGEYREALGVAAQAIEVAPTTSSAYLAQIDALLGAGDPEEALRLGRDLLLKRPEWDEAYFNLGRIKYALGQVAEAECLFRKTTSMNPSHADAQFAVATCSLASGRFDHGWKEYESRLKLVVHQASVPERYFRSLGGATWAGENLEGKTIILCSEQGFGDTIQFVRLVPQLTAKGGRTVLVTFPELKDLFKNTCGISEVVAFGEPHPRFDYKVSLCSLPCLLGLTLKDLPLEVPYLFAPASHKSSNLLQEEDHFRVGVFWSTNRLNALDHRSISSVHFFRLFEIDGIQFYSFQINESSAELESKYAGHPSIRSLRPIIRSFYDTAYFVSRMDVIISIDSAIAHLAGALGSRVWLLLPPNSEWRWLSRDPRSRFYVESPWYPTMRLFRASRFDHWEDVLDQVVNELKNALGLKLKNVQ
jgi:tetratricopeptide (TPR) repeat protein